MRKIAVVLFLLLSFSNTRAQVYLTKNGFIGFYSSTPLEDIKAEHKQVYAVIDAAKKNLAFSLLLKGFVFPKKLMQEHFNENYVESDQFPKSSFSGSYTGNVDLSKNGVYPVMVQGNLTLHGVTRPVEVPATIEVRNDQLIGKANFKVSPSDYNIRIPALVKDKIAKLIDVQVMVQCTKAK